MKKLDSLSKKDRQLILSLLLIYVLLFFLINILHFNRLFESMLSPIILLRETLPVFIAIFLFWKLYVESPQSNFPPLTNDQAVSEYVIKLCDSQQLLTALRTALPKGVEDEKYGLDFIPFILHRLEEKRSRFQKSAFRFLLALFALGATFVLVIIYFGYIMINESASGTPKNLVEIKSEVRAINNNLGFLVPKLNENDNFKRFFTKKFDALRNLEPSGQNNKSIHEKISKSLVSVEKLSDLKAIIEIINKETPNISKEDEQGRRFYEAANSLSFNLSTFLSQGESAFDKLDSSSKELDKLIQVANAEMGKSENRVSELIKRMILSLVISSFFIAILRYMAILYRNHYQQMINAENEDNMVRKFYIAYKGSAASLEERKTVLNAFMRGLSEPDKSDKGITSISKEEAEVMKEILNVLAKKL